MLKTSDFDFNLPKELIAQEPASKRDHARLMVLDRKKQTIQHKHFYEIIEYFSPGDLLVLNDTKVIPANLVGRKADGGAKVEVLLVKQIIQPAIENRGSVWECLVKPGKRLKVGSKVIFGEDEVVGTVIEKTETGEQIIEFEGKLGDFMRREGQIPLPPYIKNPKSENRNPKQIQNPKSELIKRYQTVYARKDGASAAPTAGLHFTEKMLSKIRDKGIQIANVTLHTGLATFKPVYAENVEEHKMYSEHFEVPEETVRALKEARRVIAVGTTSVRTLETIYNSPPSAFGGIPPLLIPRLRSGQVREGEKGGELIGETNLFIYPGYKFKAVDAMITNFHWPRTTLIMLVSAFAGKDFILKAYQEAIRERYRFFSFGDAMLIV